MRVSDPRPIEDLHGQESAHQWAQKMDDKIDRSSENKRGSLSAVTWQWVSEAFPKEDGSTVGWWKEKKNQSEKVIVRSYNGPIIERLDQVAEFMSGTGTGRYEYRQKT